MARTNSTLTKQAAESVKRALTGNLYIDENPYDQRPYNTVQAAVMCVAAAQLRAIRFALDHGNDGLCESTEEGRGWVGGDTFTKNDAVTALGGVMAVLQEAAFLDNVITEVLDVPHADNDSAEAAS